MHLALFCIAIVALSLGGVLAALLYRSNRAAHLTGLSASLIGTLAAVASAAAWWRSGLSTTWQIATTIPLLTLDVHFDYLAAFFVMIIGTIASLVTVYSVGYLRQYYTEHRLAPFLVCYNLFMVSMLLVVTAGNTVYFLLAWELMSLTSYCLVIFEHRRRSTVRAGLLYFIMTHIATACLVLMFVLLANNSGSLAFNDFHTAASNLSPLAASVIFLLALIGFGTKAGIIPLHVWLPEAHPAAPSSISALMSGVMIKMGIYMLIRVLFEFTPAAPLWWGILIVAIGAISSLLGVLYALTEHDIKRLLAYHSVENIGIIMLGIGSAVVFLAQEKPAIAAVGIIASLYHTLNHAVFKTLLFLGAGAVVSQTGTTNMETHGGLIKRMPWTAGFFLISSLAISGIVPFNGFISEWLTFQTLLQGINNVSGIVKVTSLGAIAALAFTGGLAAACFVKAFGITFLARPRSVESEAAQEVSRWETGSMAALAAACIALSVLASRVLAELRHITTLHPAWSATVPFITARGATLALDTHGFSPATMAAAVLIIIAGVAAATWWLTRRRQVVFGPTWNCGTPLTPRMEITATAFSRALVVIFRGILRGTRQTSVEYHDARLRYFPTTTTITLHVPNLYTRWMYRPAAQALFFGTHQLRRIQTGNVHVYLLYIFLTLVGLMLWVTWSS